MENNTTKFYAVRIGDDLYKIGLNRLSLIKLMLDLGLHEPEDLQMVSLSNLDRELCTASTMRTIMPPYATTSYVLKLHAEEKTHGVSKEEGIFDLIDPKMYDNSKLPPYKYTESPEGSTEPNERLSTDEYAKNSFLEYSVVEASINRTENTDKLVQDIADTTNARYTTPTKNSSINFGPEMVTN